MFPAPAVEVSVGPRELSWLQRCVLPQLGDALAEMSGIYIDPINWTGCLKIHFLSIALRFVFSFLYSTLMLSMFSTAAKTDMVKNHNSSEQCIHNPKPRDQPDLGAG